MKTNNKKKIVVSVLALAMGAGLAGSISGSVAWYQYSTRTSAAIAGTTAGTSRNLQISSDDGAHWSQHIDLASAADPVKFRPTSVYGSAGSLTFVDHPVYKTSLLPAAVDQEGSVYKMTYNLVFKCEDTSTGSTKQIAKEVYLTELNIVDVSETTEDPLRNITPAVRIEIDGTNDFVVAKTAGTTATYGSLDLNGNNIADKNGYDANDQTGDEIEYRNSADSDGYTAVDPSSVKVDSSNAYTFGGTSGKLLATTTATEDGNDGKSGVVKVTVWIEGWQKLPKNPSDVTGSSIWDAGWLAQNFRIEMQFACEANR